VIVIGIDPGKSGGIAWWRPTAHHAAMKMPATERDLADVMKDLADNDCFAYIEKVHAMPGQGVTSMFTFGQNYGFLRGCLIAHGIPFEEVTPQKWQKEFGLVFPKKMGLTPTEKKNRHKAKAQQLFPHLKVTHATADALLIAEYGRRLQLVLDREGM
jgi:hypothetical protein